MKQIANTGSSPSAAPNGAMAWAVGSLTVLAAIVIGTAQAVSAEPDPAAGQKAFGRCASCHSLEPGENGVGPTLAGVVGRQSGSAPGYSYSNTLKSANIVWDEASLEKYLQNPARFMRGTKMFVGLPNPDDRRNVIAFLKSQSP